MTRWGEPSDEPWRKVIGNGLLFLAIVVVLLGWTAVQP